MSEWLRWRSYCKKMGVPVRWYDTTHTLKGKLSDAIFAMVWTPINRSYLGDPDE